MATNQVDSVRTAKRVTADSDSGRHLPPITARSGLPSTNAAVHNGVAVNASLVRMETDRTRMKIDDVSDAKRDSTEEISTEK